MSKILKNQEITKKSLFFYYSIYYIIFNFIYFVLKWFLIFIIFSLLLVHVIQRHLKALILKSARQNNLLKMFEPKKIEFKPINL